MRQFCIIVTQENRLRFRFLKKEHGLLHDVAERKSYALVKDAYPTNWAGRWSRAYLVHESAAQTIELDNAPHEVRGGTVEVKEPLNMIAKLRMPSARGTEGQEREVHLTAESIYDRTLSAQVRRLGNRRIQWFHALLFVSLGVAICLALVAAITLMSGGAAAPPNDAPTIVIPSPGAPAPAGAQPEIVVSGPTLSKPTQPLARARARVRAHDARARAHTRRMNTHGERTPIARATLQRRSKRALEAHPGAREALTKPQAATTSTALRCQQQLQKQRSAVLRVPAC